MFSVAVVETVSVSNSAFAKVLFSSRLKKQIHLHLDALQSDRAALTTILSIIALQPSFCIPKQFSPFFYLLSKGPFEKKKNPCLEFVLDET